MDGWLRDFIFNKSVVAFVLLLQNFGVKRYTNSTGIIKGTFDKSSFYPFAVHMLELWQLQHMLIHL